VDTEKDHRGTLVREHAGHDVDTLKFVELIEKDTKRFPDTHGWGYAEFAYDAASDTFKPAVNDAKCGAQCHEIAGPAKDYIFNAYAKR
jgi:hypothetical protein